MYEDGYPLFNQEAAKKVGHLKVCLCLLNQARAWFLRIDPVGLPVCVFVCVCVSAPEAIYN